MRKHRKATMVRLGTVAIVVLLMAMTMGFETCEVFTAAYDSAQSEAYMWWANHLTLHGTQEDYYSDNCINAFWLAFGFHAPPAEYGEEGYSGRGEGLQDMTQALIWHFPRPTFPVGSSLVPFAEANAYCHTVGTGPYIPPEE